MQSRSFGAVHRIDATGCAWLLDTPVCELGAFNRSCRGGLGHVGRRFDRRGDGFRWKSYDVATGNASLGSFL